MKIRNLVLGMGLVASGAWAQNIAITSFTRIGDYNTNLGELCGQVTGATASMTYVKITPDYDTGYEGVYNTFTTGPNGGFCQVLRTVFGRARAEIVVDGSSAPVPALKSATAKIK